MSLATQRRFWDLLIASFGALFFEMVLVRWLPTTLYYLGYYKNCILLATFLGFGCGCATQRRVERALPYFMLLVAAMVLGASITEHYTRILPPMTGEFLWPQAKASAVTVPILILLVAVFVVSALLVLPLGRLIGTHLDEFPPITAYSINIGASLLGVASFLLLARWSVGPVIWFTIAALPILYFVRGSRRGVASNLAGLLIVIGVLQSTRSPLEYWSPYSKISLEDPLPLVGARLLMTNNNGHQVLFDLSKARFASRANSQHPRWAYLESARYTYESAYQIIRPRSVLIVGGGTGNEAAAALRNGVEHIDVVEIDPIIISIGKAVHPEHPYDDPRVTIINDDARHYMATTEQRYDLVILGFLDSTSYLSGLSNIRLDNYVYTVEGFNQARLLLKPDGLLQVTYYALADFVRLRLFLMMQHVFLQPPRIMQLRESPGFNVIFFVGPAVSAKPPLALPGLVENVYTSDLSTLTRNELVATDDWPYLNVRGRSIGGDYWRGLAAMALISLLFVRWFVWSSDSLARPGSSGAWCLFLQGAGFMLIETNTITRMALILGSTWIVTSVAVMLVLLAALVSNIVVQKFTRPSVSLIIFLLLASTLMNYAVDIHNYMALPSPISVALASLQVYCPMLASSLLFGRLFQQSDKSSYDFGMNILGAVLGGMLEYSSMVVGVRAVYLLALALFLAVLLPYRRMVAERLRVEERPWTGRGSVPASAVPSLD